MDYLDANSPEIINYLETEAKALGPHDPLTKAAYVIQKIVIIPTMPLLLISIPVKNVVGCCLGAIILMPLSLIWLPFFGYALGTSWLWIKVPILRPILLLPSVLINTIGVTYVAFIPDFGEPFQKALKGALCDSWPYSWHIYQLSKELYNPEDTN